MKMRILLPLSLLLFLISEMNGEDFELGRKVKFVQASKNLARIGGHLANSK